MQESMHSPCSKASTRSSIDTFDAFSCVSCYEGTIESFLNNEDVMMTTTTTKGGTEGELLFNNNNNNNNVGSLDQEESTSPKQYVRPSIVAECPLSSSCSLEEDLILHLKRKHGILDHFLELEEGSVTRGSVCIESPVSRSKGPRRSALLLHFLGSMFLWSVETRMRADGEIQASAVLQYLGTETKDDEAVASSSAGSPPTTPSTAFPSPRLSMSSSNNNNSRNLGRLDELWRVTVRIESDSNNNSSAESNNNSNNSTALPPPNGDGSSSTSNSSNSLDEGLRWEGVLGQGLSCNLGEKSVARRHDRLVSQGMSAVALYPTHRTAFRAVKTAEGDLLIAVFTQIERLR